MKSGFFALSCLIFIHGAALITQIDEPIDSCAEHQCGCSIQSQQGSDCCCFGGIENEPEAVVVLEQSCTPGSEPGNLSVEYRLWPPVSLKEVHYPVVIVSTQQLEDVILVPGHASIPEKIPINAATG